jgi:integrase
MKFSRLSLLSLNLEKYCSLPLFLYSGMREDEVAHLYWNNVLWQGNEIEVKDKLEWGFHPKTYETRNIKIHAYLLGVLKEHYVLRKNNGLIFPNEIQIPKGISLIHSSELPTAQASYAGYAAISLTDARSAKRRVATVRRSGFTAPGGHVSASSWKNQSMVYLSVC